MQKKGGTKALFGRPNRSNRPFAFFVRIDKIFLSFALLFSLFFVHCRFCAFLLCFYSAVFLSSRQKALPFLLRPVFLLYCRCFFAASPRFSCCTAAVFHHLILSFRPGRHHHLPVSLLCFCRIGRVLPAFFIHCLFGLFHRCENSRKKQKRNGSKTSSNPFRFLI